MPADDGATGLWCCDPGAELATLLAGQVTAVDLAWVGLSVAAAQRILIGRALPPIEMVPAIATVAGLAAEDVADALIAAGGRVYTATTPGGAQIRRWRVARGMTQEDLSVLLGRAEPSTVSRWETGRAGWTARLIRDVAAVDLALALAISRAEGLPDPPADVEGDWAMLGRLRSEAGFTVQMFADLLGVTPGRWRTYEAGRIPTAQVDPEVLAAAAALLGVDEGDVFAWFASQASARTFGRRILTARLSRRVSTEEVCRHVGVDRRVLHRWERGVVTCRDQARVQLLEGLFGLPDGYLMAHSAAAPS